MLTMIGGLQGHCLLRSQTDSGAPITCVAIQQDNDDACRVAFSVATGHIILTDDFQ